jgi:hypothetical protein
MSKSNKTYLCNGINTLLVTLITSASVVVSRADTTNSNLPPEKVQPATDKSAPFDYDVGSDASWAAEKKLIGLFRAEGCFLHAHPYTDFEAARKAGYPENGHFERLKDGARVEYAYRRPLSFGQPAIYRLSGSRNSPGFAVLLSVCGKISADRLSAINDAIREFETTKKPAVKSKGDFNQRGDFRVKVDQNELEIENLWKGKGL